MILQEFYKDTLASSYIKSLLCQTPIPMFPAVLQGEYIVKDCYYVYKTNIIKCVVSGVLGDGGKYNVIQSANVVSLTTHHTFCSNFYSYDPTTHKYLGDYIRWIQTSTGLNLLPFYNCYSAFDIATHSLSVEGGKVKLNLYAQPHMRVVAVPIKFEKTYTISIDSDQPVLLRPCLYNMENSLLLENHIDGMSFVSELFDNNSTVMSRTSFKTPFKYSISLSSTDNDTQARLLYNQQNCLYLFIQLPIDNTTSICVLEDTSTIITTPSLQFLNTHKSYAFSGRLIEYLLGNVIHPDDSVYLNIAKIQAALKETTNYTPLKLGTWDDSLSQVLKDIILTAPHELSFDHDGNINVDVEKLIELKGCNY